MRSGTASLALACLLGPAFAQTFAPIVRPFHVGNPAAFDTVRRRLVMFADDGVTWELDGGELLPRADLDGATTPPRRTGHAMCYDEARRHVLLFGGTLAGTTVLANDTWIYDGSRWTQRTSAATPGARSSAITTWDSTRNRVLMWGGLGAAGGLADTWEHDGSNWLQRAPATAPPSSTCAIAFDRQRGVAVLTRASGAFSVGAETWEWDGNNWLQRASNGPNFAIGTNPTMAFDVLRNRTVFAGGSPNDRIWEWDGTSWSAASLPQPFRRREAASWFDPGCGCVAIFGGIDYEPNLAFVPGSRRFDRRHWNGQALTLVQDDAGPRTWDGILLPDPLRRRMLYFGGWERPAPTFSSLTWALTDGTWSLVTSPTGPSPRMGSAAAFDLFRGEGLLFGGSAGNVLFGDTWSIAGSGWVARTISGPSPRDGAAMAADLLRSVVVLFGGLGASGVLNDDTWEWNGAIWTQRFTTSAPTARTAAAMAFHPQLNRMLLFGGFSGTLINDTWTWDGTQWTALAPPTTPVLVGATMSTDFATNRCILMGSNLTAGQRQQIWAHTGSDWQLLLDEPIPGSAAWSPCNTGPRLDTWICRRGGGTVAELTFLPGRIATTGAGCGTPASKLLVRSRPRIGATTGLELVANGNRAVVFGIDPNSGSTPLGGGCTLWLGPGWLGLLQISDAAGFASQQLAVPANPTLRGLDLFGQAAVLEPLSSNGLVLTEGLRLTVGD